MQYGTMRSVALALTQTALGLSERQAAVCWLLSAKWGQFALGVFLSLWGYKGWHIQGGGLNTGGVGKWLNVVFRDEFREAQVTMMMMMDLFAEQCVQRRSSALEGIARPR